MFKTAKPSVCVQNCLVVLSVSKPSVCVYLENSVVVFFSKVSSLCIQNCKLLVLVLCFESYNSIFKNCKFFLRFKFVPTRFEIYLLRHKFLNQVNNFESNNLYYKIFVK